MTLDQLRDLYNQGEYRTKIQSLTYVVSDYIFDEELSVRRNRELAAEHNERVRQVERDRRADDEALAGKLKRDICLAVSEEYGFTFDQASKLLGYLLSLEDNRFVDVFDRMPALAGMVASVLGST